MFGRRRAAGTGTPTPTSARVNPLAVAVASPDAYAITRERALRNMTGRMMQGQAGLVIDYDRGDPAHSETRVIPGVNQPTDALARIGMKDALRLPQAEVYDLSTTDQQLSAYQASLFARIAR